MSRGSFGRTVARAAASGGSKSYRARPPVLWYAAIVVIVLGGSGLIAYSRNEALHRTTPASQAPTTSDNWYTAFALDVCGTLQHPLPANTNLTSAGIRTFGDGIININPGSVANSSAFTGSHATLGTFVSTYGHGLTLTRSELAIPLPGAVTAATTTTTSTTTTSTTTAKGVTTTTPKAKGTAATTTTATGGTAGTGTKGSTGKAAKRARTPTITPPAVHRYVAGSTCATGRYAGRKATIVVKTWSSPTATGRYFTGDPSTIRLTNGGMITVAFVPAGSAIPVPGSRSTLLQDLGKK